MTDRTLHSIINRNKIKINYKDRVLTVKRDRAVKWVEGINPENYSTVEDFNDIKGEWENIVNMFPSKSPIPLSDFARCKMIKEKLQANWPYGKIMKVHQIETFTIAELQMIAMLKDYCNATPAQATLLALKKEMLIKEVLQSFNKKFKKKIIKTRTNIDTLKYLYLFYTGQDAHCPVWVPRFLKPVCAKKGHWTWLGFTFNADVRPGNSLFEHWRKKLTFFKEKEF